MSTVKTNNVQIGQSVTATNNFTWYQPASPDGTVRLGNGNSGSVTDLVTLTSAGNLGIGTSSPTARLSLSGSAASNIATFTDGTVNGELFFGSTGNRSFQLGTHNAYPLIFYTNNANTLTLDSSGNLGLGVTPSGWNSLWPSFQVKNASFTGCPAIADFAAMGANLVATGSGYPADPTVKYISNGYATAYRQIGGEHAWYTAPSGTAGNAISFTKAMTLDASGNLYVGGTTAFGAKINCLGNFGCWTATAAISGYVGANVFRVDSTTVPTLEINNQGATGRFVTFQTNGASQVGSISFTNTNTAYNTSSDERLKTNVQPSGSAIQSILDFPVDQFDWISSGEHQDFGAVAQKAINFIPEMVSVPADPDEMWGIDWSKAVPRLIKTIQEMHEEIQTLKQKVNA